jgi:hypothetical protein
MQVIVSLVSKTRTLTYNGLNGKTKTIKTKTKTKKKQKNKERQNNTIPKN